MKYQVQSYCKADYTLDAQVDNFYYLQDRWAKTSTTPVGFLAMAYNGCIAMSVKSYFLRILKIDDFEVKVETELDADLFVINSKVYLEAKYFDYLPEIEVYVAKLCKVSHFLSDKVVRNIEYIKV